MTADSRRALFLGASLGLFAFSAALAWNGWSDLRRPWFDPRASAWAWSVSAPTTVAMDYYGKLGFAALAGVAVAAAATAIASRRSISDRVLGVAGAWGVLSLVFGITLSVWNFSHRSVSAPRDLPAPTETKTAAP